MAFDDSKKYTDWILANVGDCHYEEIPGKGFLHVVGCIGTTDDGEPLIQRCDVAAPMMAKAFPELKVIYGSYKAPGSEYYLYHVWCVTPAGLVVDPTGRQFDLKNGVDSYRNGDYWEDSTDNLRAE